MTIKPQSTATVRLQKYAGAFDSTKAKSAEKQPQSPDYLPYKKPFAGADMVLYPPLRAYMQRAFKFSMACFLSWALKTAVPATQMSAPPLKAWFIVDSFIPPST